jgi:hypothetical protein
MPVLHQVIAVEKGVKNRTNTAITELHRTSKTPALFEGLSRKYRVRAEGEETFPDENTIVQKNASEQVRTLKGLLTELIDTTAQKDFANTQAKASIKIGVTVLAADVPVSHLLFLEKQLNDMRTFLTDLPTLDPAVEWNKDPNGDNFRSGTITTHKTKKVQKPITMAPATDKHPAQTQMITDDATVGYWDTVKISGAMPIPRKRVLLERVETLMKAVKFAREEANGSEAPEKKIAAGMLDYLFAE